jgi:hypothetical protein
MAPLHVVEDDHGVGDEAVDEGGLSAYCMSRKYCVLYVYCMCTVYCASRFY